MKNYIELKKMINGKELSRIATSVKEAKALISKDWKETTLLNKVNHGL